MGPRTLREVARSLGSDAAVGLLTVAPGVAAAVGMVVAQVAVVANVVVACPHVDAASLRRSCH